jgi:hypothetical protein
MLGSKKACTGVSRMSSGASNRSHYPAAITDVCHCHTPLRFPLPVPGVGAKSPPRLTRGVIPSFYLSPAPNCRFSPRSSQMASKLVTSNGTVQDVWTNDLEPTILQALAGGEPVSMEPRTTAYTAVYNYIMTRNAAGALVPSLYFAPS